MIFSFKILNDYQVMYGVSISVDSALKSYHTFISTTKNIMTIFCNGFVPDGIFIEIIHTV